MSDVLDIPPNHHVSRRHVSLTSIKRHKVRRSDYSEHAHNLIAQLWASKPYSQGLSSAHCNNTEGLQLVCCQVDCNNDCNMLLQVSNLPPSSKREPFDDTACICWFHEAYAGVRLQ